MNSTSHKPPRKFRVTKSSSSLQYRSLLYYPIPSDAVRSMRWPERKERRDWNGIRSYRSSRQSWVVQIRALPRENKGRDCTGSGSAGGQATPEAEAAGDAAQQRLARQQHEERRHAVRRRRVRVVRAVRTVVVLVRHHPPLRRREGKGKRKKKKKLFQ